MSEQAPWWDLGHQASRANYAFWQHHGYDANAQKPIAQVQAEAAQRNHRIDMGQGRWSDGENVYDENGMYLNSYAAVTAANAQATPAAPSLSGIETSQSAQAQKNSALRDLLISQAQQRRNPFGEEGLSDLLGQVDDSVNRNFANAKRQGQEDLAVRGMMGSGQESAILNAINAEKAAAHSAGQRDVRTQYLNQRAAWDSNQQSYLAQLANQDLGYQQLSDLGGSLRQQSQFDRSAATSDARYQDEKAWRERSYQNERDQQLGKTVADLTGLAVYAGGTLMGQPWVGPAYTAATKGIQGMLNGGQPSSSGTYSGRPYMPGSQEYSTYKPKDGMDFYGPTTTNQNVGPAQSYTYNAVQAKPSQGEMLGRTPILGGTSTAKWPKWKMGG